MADGIRVIADPDMPKDKAWIGQPDPLVLSVHEAMMNAPHDGQPFRMARAAIQAVGDELRRRWGKEGAGPLTDMIAEEAERG